MSVFTVVFTVGMFSCQEDLLSPLPKNQIADVNIFDSPDRIALLVNGMYTTVKNGNFLGGRTQIYGDIRANDFVNRTTNGVTGYLVWQHTINEASQNDVINQWTFAYQAINNINLFLDGIEANKDKYVPPVFPATFYTNTVPLYVAEAKFLRAVSYHYLIQFYSKGYVNGGNNLGVPLRLNGETTSENNLLARATLDQMYTQILKDLDEAEAALPLTYSTATAANTSLNVTRAHKNSARAFKTRVYLTKGDWAKVIEEANKIVPAAAPFQAPEGVAHQLVSNINSLFAAPQENAEMIFAFPFSAQNTPGGQNQLGFYYRAAGNTANPAPAPGGGEFGLNTTASGIAGDSTLWPATDGRRTAWTYINNKETFLGKYPSGTPYLDKAPVIRYAEVLLNLSEAIARTTGGVDSRALALLNAVRVRAAGLIDHDDDPTTATVADPQPYAPADNAALIDAIFNERRIEFLGEGLRNMDIMRVNGNFPGKSGVSGTPAAPNYVWPIPISERAVNTLCEPN